MDLNNHIAFSKNKFDTYKKESSEKYEKNISEIVDLEKAKKELENIVFKVGQSAQTMHMLAKSQNFYDETHKTALGYQNPLYLSQARRKQPALYNGTVLIDKHNLISVCDSEETLILAKGFIAEVTKMKDIFEQIEDEVDQCSMAKKCFEIKKKQLLINNDRLLEENIASDIMCTYLRSLKEVDNYGKCKSLNIVLLDLQESNKSLCEMRKRFAKLEEYIISLDIAFQNHKEKMINDSQTNNNNHLVQAINNQSFKINDLKVQLQDKLHVINESKHILAQKSQKTQCELPVFDSRIQKIEDENVSLAFQVSSLVKEREHIKLEYKKLYDSIK
ncbi:hypothetical protein Tco_1571001 [Tanacetum coccineum]